MSNIQNNVEVHILKMNFLEFLTSYLEGRTTLSMILKMSERIRARDTTTLSPSLISATTTLHKLKESIDRGEKMDTETVVNIVDDVVLSLTDRSKD